MSFIVLSCAPTLVAPVNPFIGSYTGTLSGTNAGIQFEVPMDAVLSGSGTGVSGSWSTPSDSGQLSASSTSSTQLSALVFSPAAGSLCDGELTGSATLNNGTLAGTAVGSNCSWNFIITLSTASSQPSAQE